MQRLCLWRPVRLPAAAASRSIRLPIMCVPIARATLQLPRASVLRCSSGVARRLFASADSAAPSSATGAAAGGTGSGAITLQSAEWLAVSAELESIFGRPKPSDARRAAEAAANAAASKMNKKQKKAAKEAKKAAAAAAAASSTPTAVTAPTSTGAAAAGSDAAVSAAAAVPPKAIFDPLSDDQTRDLNAAVNAFLCSGENARRATVDVWHKLLWTIHKRSAGAALPTVRVVMDTLLSLQPAAAAAAAGGNISGRVAPPPLKLDSVHASAPMQSAALSIAAAAAAAVSATPSPRVSTKSFNIVMEAASRAGDADVLLHYWNAMSRYGVAPDVYSFGTLLNFLSNLTSPPPPAAAATAATATATASPANAVIGAYEQMRTYGIAINQIIATTLLSTLARYGQVEALFRVFDYLFPNGATAAATAAGAPNAAPAPVAGGAPVLDHSLLVSIMTPFATAMTGVRLASDLQVAALSVLAASNQAVAANPDAYTAKRLIETGSKKWESPPLTETERAKLNEFLAQLRTHYTIAAAAAR